MGKCCVLALLIILSSFSLITSETVASDKGDIVMRVKAGRSEVLASSNVTLICETTTNVGRIKWYQNGRRIAVTRRPKPSACSIFRANKEYGYSCKGTRLTLVLTEVTSKDTGSFSCEDPQVKKVSNKVEINVIIPTTEPPTSDLPTSVAIYGGTLKVIYGVTPIWLTCTGNCDDNFVFGWDYGNMTGNISSMIRSEGVCSQSLTVWVRWEHDKSVVSCTVRNPNTEKQITENMTLNLAYMPLNPLITISPSGPVQEGREVNITCRPRPPGKPPGRTDIVVRAVNDKKSFTSKSPVTFKVSREYDGAEIRCFTVNKYTTGNSSAYTTTKYLSVLYSPKLEVMSNVTMSENGTQSVIFTCTARGNPDKMTFSPWKHMNGSVVVRELQGENTATSSVLRMTSLRYADNGIYICNATNGIGVNGSKYNFHWTSLVVEGTPYFPGENGDDVAVVTTLANTSLTLTFRYIAKPKATVTWYVNGNPLNTSKADKQLGTSTEKVKIDVYGMSIYRPGHEERLMFPSVSSADDGDYHISVCNVHGCRNSSVIRVVVSDDIDYAETASPDDSPNMAMIIGLSAAAAVLVIVLVIVVALLVQRRKCGTHDTADEREEHTANGVSIVKGNPTYDRDCLAENGRSYHNSGDNEKESVMGKESVMVVIKSSLYGKPLMSETRTRESKEEGDEEKEERKKDDKDETEVEVSEETRKIVTEIYSQVQKPRSSQKGSSVSDDVPDDITGEKGADDAFHDIDLAEREDKDLS